jgi:hypothetical protein
MPAATMSRSDEKSARKPDVKPRGEFTPRGESRPGASVSPDATPEQKILYQTFFKSVGTRTYAAQVKEARNGNHFILFIEGNRDKKTGELRKTKLILFSEDFEAFFNLIADTATYVRAHPVSPEIARRQAKRAAR